MGVPNEKPPKCVAVIQARTGSTRLPGKVLLPLGAGTVLQRVIRRALNIPGIDGVCVAVPDGSTDDRLAEHVAAQPDCILVRGSEKDVLARYAKAARETGADYVLRITSDCPAIDPGVCATVLQAALQSCSYARTSLDSGYPLGLDTEAMPAEFLYLADREAADPAEREHVTPFLWRRPDCFPQTIVDRTPDRRRWRLTLDERTDYILFQRIEEGLGEIAETANFAILEKFLLDNPDILEINRNVPHKFVSKTTH